MKGNRMKINGRFVIREIAGDTIIVPVGETALRYNGIITINKSAVALWEALEKGTDTESMIRLLTDRYDVDPDTAAADVAEFLDRMRKAELIEE